MKFRVLIGLVLFISLTVTIFYYPVELIKELSAQPLNEETLSSPSHSNVIKTDEMFETNSASVNKVVSKTQPEASETLEDKQEQLVLPEISIEQSIKFVSVDSELHQKLLKKLRKKIPDERLNNKKDYDFGVDLDGGIYSVYKSDIGFEFYEKNVDWHEQFEGIDDHFRKWLELQEQELEKLEEWNAKNESIIYQLVNEFNYLSVEEYNLPNISPVNVDCRGNICSVHFSHPTNVFNKSGEDVFVDDLKAVLAFRRFFMEKRSWCKCRGFEYFSRGWNESSFRFVFD